MICWIRLRFVQNDRRSLFDLPPLPKEPDVINANIISPLSCREEKSQVPDIREFGRPSESPSSLEVNREKVRRRRYLLDSIVAHFPALGDVKALGRLLVCDVIEVQPVFIDILEQYRSADFLAVKQRGIQCPSWWESLRLDLF